MAIPNEPVWMRLAVSGKWERGTRTRLEIRDFEPLYSDEPPSFGGQDSAPNPMELLLASLNGCLTVMTVIIAKEQGVDIQDIQLHAEGELDLRGAMGVPGVAPYFKSVRERVEILSNASPEQIERLKQEVQRRCPVFTLLKTAGIELHSEWVVVRPVA